MSEDATRAEDEEDDQPSDSPTLNYASPGAGPSRSKLVTIATFGQAWEAHLAAGKLEAEGIAAVIADENIVGTGGGLYTNMVGGVKLQVPQVDADRALAALPKRVRAVHVNCPRCRSIDTRQIDFSPGVKILFLLLLGLPYLFVQKPWYCLDCGNVWRAASGGAPDSDDEDEEQDEEQDEDDDGETVAENAPR
jgi:hypothetical protein